MSYELTKNELVIRDLAFVLVLLLGIGWAVKSWIDLQRAKSNWRNDHRV